MKEATEKALKATVEKANNSPALDAMQLTQAALNLAHVLATLNNIEQTKTAYHDAPLYLAPGAQPKLDEIKIALHRALELGKRETWTGAKKYRSREDQCEEQQCWDKVWNLLGAKGE